jgi:hypothetical protein
MIRYLILGDLIIAVILFGCSPSAVSVTETMEEPSVFTDMTASSSTVTATSNLFPDPILKIIGEEEVVFDWMADKCEDENIPDLPVRAFRDAGGQVQLLISHYISYRMIGDSLNQVKINCEPVFESKRNADPSFFTDAEWIESVYTEDGQTIYAIVHNEYHGFAHPNQCNKSQDNWWLICWNNTLTLVASNDMGATYNYVVAPPNHLIASLPYIYEIDAGPYGVMNASNIIKKDGFYYAFIRLDYYRSDQQRTCLMRTSNLADPLAWRYWNGIEFVGEFLNPYVQSISDPSQHICNPIDPQGIGEGMIESLTYNTVLNRYVLLGLSADTINGREVWGVYYAFSDDLINWTYRKLLKEMPLPWTVTNSNDTFYLYPALLDPESETLNFETVGETAYMYYTRLNFGGGSLDRDLLRVKVEFFPSP